MRVRVMKPDGGPIRVVLDDRRGPTGRRDRAECATLSEAQAFVESGLTAWEASRKTLNDARMRTVG